MLEPRNREAKPGDCMTMVELTAYLEFHPARKAQGKNVLDEDDMKVKADLWE
jgi:hypothetical protein